MTAANVSISNALTLQRRAFSDCPRLRATQGEKTSRSGRASAPRTSAKSSGSRVSILAGPETQLRIYSERTIASQNQARASWLITDDGLLISLRRSARRDIDFDSIPPNQCREKLGSVFWVLMRIDCAFRWASGRNALDCLELAQRCVQDSRF
jgi:hypothetical protein